MHDVFNEILKRILDWATGFDLLVAVAGCLIGIICWLFAGARKEEKDKLIRKIKAIRVPTLIGIILIAINHLILAINSSTPPKQFAPGVLGVLVLRIVGDSDCSLQRELVSSLNNKLSPATNGPPIEVWAFEDSVEESQGLMKAHDEARKIGEKSKALFVVWGSKVGETRLFPRITMVKAIVPAGNRTLMEQNIRELVSKDSTLVTFFRADAQQKSPQEKNRP